MTTTTREELLELLTSILPPDPLAHDYFCPKCGGTDHKVDCTWLLASNLCAAYEAGGVEFDDDDDAKEPTRPGQRVRMTFDRNGLFKAGDEFTVAEVRTLELCGDRRNHVRFEGREDLWPCWWFEVVDGKDGE